MKLVVARSPNATIGSVTRAASLGARFGELGCSAYWYSTLSAETDSVRAKAEGEHKHARTSGKQSWVEGRGKI